MYASEQSVALWRFYLTNLAENVPKVPSKNSVVPFKCRHGDAFGTVYRSYQEEPCMSQPLLVEIIAYAPTAYYHCTHCEVAWRAAGAVGATNRIQEEQIESSLPEDLIEEYQTVSDWVKEMFRVHCDAIILKVIDAASVEGFYKSLKYNARHYPAVIVNGKFRFLGSKNLSAASEEIAHQLVSQPAG